MSPHQTTPSQVPGLSTTCFPCMFSMLFAETPELARRTEEARSKLLGGVGLPFVAAHVRLGGGLRGEEVQTTDQVKQPHHSGSAFVAQFAALACVRQMGVFIGQPVSPDHPAIFVTDNLRAWRRGRACVGCAAPLSLPLNFLGE